MVKSNKNYTQLLDNYLFFEIEKRASCIKKKDLCNLGIGDITLPVPKTIIKALAEAATELIDKATLKGYGPSQGHMFLRHAIWKNAYQHLPITPEEIFVQDGVKNAISHFHDLFCHQSKVAICDPSYPVYIDANVMAGRAFNPHPNGRYQGITYLSCLEENQFLPKIPDTSLDIIYLCSPNNPTGVAFTKEDLIKWIKFAKEQKAIIFYDGAYEAFISDDTIPRSIYEIPGADEVAIEFRSFSKSAGFTALRCSYAIVPKKLQTEDNHSIHAFYKRYVDTKYGGTSYPIQKAAYATFSKEGKEALQKNMQTYKNNASLLREGLQQLGYTVFGGIHSPYIWCKTKNQLNSWDFFEQLLHKAHVIGIPGRGFGLCGEGFIRFSAFAKEEIVKKALDRIASNL